MKVVFLILILILIIVYVVCNCNNYVQQFLGKRLDPSKCTLIYYFKPICPYCVEFSEQWEKTEKILKKQGIKYTKINMNEKDKSGQIVGDVQGVPTLILQFNHNGNVRVPYPANRERTAEDINEWVNELINA